MKFQRRKNKNFSSANKWRDRQKILFLKNLALLLENGFSINESMMLLPNIWPEEKTKLRYLKNEMQKNIPMDKLLLQLGFSQTTATQIKMALDQGTLLTCLNQLVTVLELKQKQTKKIVQELSYPAIIVGLMMILMIFMKGFLANYLPQVRLSIWEIIGYGVLIGVAIIGLFAIIFCVVAIKSQNYFQLKIISHWPVIGAAVKFYVQYLVLFNLQIMLANGFSVAQICQFCREQNQKSVQFHLGNHVEHYLKIGKSYHRIISSDAFLPQELNFVTETGSNRQNTTKQILVLEEMVYQKLIDKLNRLSLKIQPICFIIIGLGIISIYAKLLLPIYKIMDTI